MNRSRAVVVGVGLALLLGVPGAATAVATIRSADIVDGQVRTPDLAAGAVTSKKVADDSLKGGDIQESTLERVPDAARVSGLRVVKVFVDDHESTSGDLLSMADLRVRYSCNNPGELFVYARVLDGSDGSSPTTPTQAALRASPRTGRRWRSPRWPSGTRRSGTSSTSIPQVAW